VLVLGLGLAIVIVLDSRQQLGQRRGRHGLMAFDHEKLDLYAWRSYSAAGWASGSIIESRQFHPGPRHENKYEHDDDCEHEHEHEHEHESCFAKA
jgi:hypothetical protein